MHSSNLGVAPVIPILAKALPGVFSFLTGKKKKEAQERAAQYAASEQAIAEGRAVSAFDVMTERDKQILRAVWPKVHVAANWTDINWAASTGMPQGPQLSPAAEAAIKHAWPQVHVAARFDDVNWPYHSVPVEKVATLLPVPELPDYMQPPRVEIPLQAGILGTDIPLPILIAGGAVLLLLLSRRR